MTSATPGVDGVNDADDARRQQLGQPVDGRDVARRRHEHRQELARRRPFAHDEVAQPAAARALVVGLEPLLPRPPLERPADVVGDVGDDVAVVDGDQPVPAAELMEPERRAVGPLRPRVLDLVAVAVELLRSDHRLGLDAGEAADPLERIDDLGVLVPQLLGVVEVLPGTAAADAEVRTAGVDPARAGLEQLDRPRLGIAALELRHPGANAVARERPRDEDHQLAVAGDAAPAVGETVDDELDLLIPDERAHPVSLRPPMPTAVDTYRRRLEDMTAEAMEEYYLHSAGHKPTYEIAAVYERYADLTTLDQARALRTEGAPTELYRFACEAYIGNGLRHLSEEIANAETALVVEVDGDSVPYREVSPRLVNEPDGERRRRLYAARCAVTAEHLNPLHEKATTLQRDLTGHLDAGSVLELYERCDYTPRELREATSAFLDSTDDLYRRHVDRQLRRRVGVPLAGAAPPDLARLWRAPEFDQAFAPERALPALRATLAGLGVAP